MQYFKNVFLSIKKYNFLIEQLVSRDFKVKYKRSILGVAWSLLYPLLTMAVMAVVFSRMFRFTTPGVNYLVYLLSGLTLFNYYTEATNLAMGSVVSNFGLISKVYLPKYIFPLTKCLFVGINFLLTLIPLYLVILCTGTGLNVFHLLLPYDYLCLFMFTLGMGFLLAAVSVFMRDMFYIYGVVITLWTYLTPIMYDMSILGDHPAIIFLFKCNPMYQFITFARTIILYHSCPTVLQFVTCGLFGACFLLIGSIVFKKTQDKFIYYI